MPRLKHNKLVLLVARGTRSLLRHILLKLGKELLVKGSIDHLLQLANLRSIFAESEENCIFVGPLKIAEWCIRKRGCVNGGLVLRCVVKD